MPFLARSQFTAAHAAAVHYRDILRLTPGVSSGDHRVCSGQPCVRDLRITALDVLGWLASGMSFEEVLADFPERTLDDIRACLAYAAARERGTSIIPPASVIS